MTSWLIVCPLKSGPWRGNQRACYHEFCDDKRMLTPENLDFMKRIVDSVAVSVARIAEWCWPEEEEKEDEHYLPRFFSAGLFRNSGPWRECYDMTLWNKSCWHSRGLNDVFMCVKILAAADWMADDNKECHILECHPHRNSIYYFSPRSWSVGRRGEEETPMRCCSLFNLTLLSDFLGMTFEDWPEGHKVLYLIRFLQPDLSWWAWQTARNRRGFRARKFFFGTSIMNKHQEENWWAGNTPEDIFFVLNYGHFLRRIIIIVITVRRFFLPLNNNERRRESSADLLRIL